MVHKSLWLSLGQSFEHITLYTYSGAAIFFGAIPIYGVLLYSIIMCCLAIIWAYHLSSSYMHIRHQQLHTPPPLPPQKKTTTTETSHKKSNEKTYRDGIPKKQPNKVGMNDTTVPLWTHIPMSFDIFPTTQSPTCHTSHVHSQLMIAVQHTWLYHTQQHVL